MAPLHLVSSNNYFQSELALNVLINPSLSLLRDAFSSINFSKRPHSLSAGSPADVRAVAEKAIRS